MSDALHDRLTGLPTPALLREHASVAVARAARHDRHVVLLHVGLDDFRLVNDGLGRDAGDAVLREAAARVREAVPALHVVARAGADELCVLLTDLPKAPEATAHAIGAQVIEALRRPFETRRGSFELGATMGGSAFPGDAPDADALLRHADAALHRAKETERGGLLFYDGGTTESLERLLMTARLRTALEQEQLFLDFQPFVALRTGRVPAAEALLRWRHPDRGVVPPLEFIPVAEHSGLIDEVGAWVMDAACRQARAWEEQELEIAVSFNVSLHEFRDEHFADRLAERMSAHGTHPTRIIVELTESTLMREPRCVEPMLAQLRRLGVRVAIDDFGTGYSSLARLRDLDVDILKIDRTFLPAAPGGRRATRVIVAALGLAEALGVTPVVEGVENEEQLSFLRDRGETLAQGFHLGRPMPPAHVADLVREGIAPA